MRKIQNGIKYIPIYKDELQHHGIKGMKWGVRRYQNPDGSLTAAGRKRYNGDNRSSTQKETNTKTSDQQEETIKKYNLKKAAVVAGAALVTLYATREVYRYVDSGKLHQRKFLKDLAFYNDKAAKERKELKNYFNENADLSKDMSSDEILDKVVSRINPDYGKFGTKTNCRRCTFAYEMSRRGYDVKATKTHGGTGQDGHGKLTAMGLIGKNRFFEYKKNNAYNEKISFQSQGNFLDYIIHMEDHGKEVASKTFEELSKQPNKSRGELGMNWFCGGRHSMAYEIINETPFIFDCQTGEKYDVDSFSKIAESITEVRYTRLDNAKLDKKFLTRWLEDA